MIDNFVALVKDSIDTMDTPSPVSPITASPQTHSERPFLACVRTLKLHFEHGGLNKKGHDMLYRMIEMSSAIGWEEHLICRSEIPLADSVANMKWYFKCILQGCEVFRTNMEASVKKTIAVKSSLSELEGNHQVSETEIMECQRKMRSLHKPTGNDRRLFELMFNHYNDVAYQRLIQLHLRKPTNGLSCLLESAKTVYMALEELNCLVKQADELVLTLNQRFDDVGRQIPKDNVDGSSTVRKQQQYAEKIPEVFLAAVYRQSEDQPTTRVNPNLSRSFGVAEEELGRRCHSRAATFSETCYTAVGGGVVSLPPNPENPLQRPAFSTRRKGTNVPRIFTGSFSQLESDLRKLQLDKIETPITLNIDGRDPVQVRDFGATPAGSPCRTLSPPPLQRREALVSRAVEFEDRLIKDEVVKIQRPSTKARAQTIDDSTGGLDAWLKQPPAGLIAASENNSAVRRGHVKHMEKTL